MFNSFTGRSKVPSPPVTLNAQSEVNGNGPLGLKVSVHLDAETRTAAGEVVVFIALSLAFATAVTDPR